MRETILREIRRLTEANVGNPPGKQSFARETGITEGQWSGRYWARWSDALVEAGYGPNKLQERFSDDSVLSKLARLAQRIGRIPTFAEMKLERRTDAEFPNHGVIQNRFKDRTDLVEALREWCLENGEFLDVVALLPTVKSSSFSEQPAKAVKKQDGGVYLIKYGQDYKIGRGDDIERRVKQVTTALPDRGEIIHSIRTDDPVGIEAYWHKRFSDKRRNGEWFRLDIQDVAAFRKRKFQ